MVDMSNIRSPGDRTSYKPRQGDPCHFYLITIRAVCARAANRHSGIPKYLTKFVCTIRSGSNSLQEFAETTPRVQVESGRIGFDLPTKCPEPPVLGERLILVKKCAGDLLRSQRIRIGVQVGVSS